MRHRKPVRNWEMPLPRHRFRMFLGSFLPSSRSRTMCRRSGQATTTKRYPPGGHYRKLSQSHSLSTGTNPSRTSRGKNQRLHTPQGNGRRMKNVHLKVTARRKDPNARNGIALASNPNAVSVIATTRGATAATTGGATAGRVPTEAMDKAIHKAADRATGNLPTRVPTTLAKTSRRKRKASRIASATGASADVAAMAAMANARRASRWKATPRKRNSVSSPFSKS